MQVIGVGSQSSFEEAQDFLAATAMTATPMLWESSGALWRLNNIRTNSAMQLMSYDLAEQTNALFFDDKGRASVLSAAPQHPWAPPSN